MLLFASDFCGLIWRCSLQLPLWQVQVWYIWVIQPVRCVASLWWWGPWWIRSYHVQHCLHLLIFLRKLWQSKNPCSWFSQSGKRYIFQRKALKCVCDVTFFHIWLRFVLWPTCADRCFYVAWWDSILQVRLCASRARSTSLYSSVLFFHPQIDSLNCSCLHKHGLRVSLFGFCSWEVFVDFQVDSRGEHSSWVLLRRQNQFLCSREPSRVWFRSGFL